jgi:deoxycytidylate deaminase
MGNYNDNELVIGIVAAVGTETRQVVALLQEELGRARYKTRHIKVSKEIIPRVTDVSGVTDEIGYDRIDSLMTKGNQARRAASKLDSSDRFNGNAVLAYGAAASIFSSRPTDNGRQIPYTRQAFIIDSLKRPEEVQALRAIYPQGFVLVGVDAVRSDRLRYLTETVQMAESNARKLIERDENEASVEHGQRVSKSFYLADFFVKLTDDNSLRHEIRRMVELLFGCPTHTPTFDEFAMFLAFSSALRSADLSRQVGAVVAKDNEIISTGANDCPAAGGGQYWPSRNREGEIVDVANGRDYKRGADSNRREQVSIIDEIVADADSKLNKKQLRNLLEKSRIRDLTEYGRVVHAEMEAILSCARRGVSTLDAELFCTTFPCHNCAKHVVDAGFKRVVYIEPYEKSKAWEFHDDSICEQHDKSLAEDKRVIFEPFSGIGPRQFYNLFSMQLGTGYEVVRKEKRSGSAVDWKMSDARLRISMNPSSYIELEVDASQAFNDMIPHDD